MPSVLWLWFVHCLDCPCQQMTAQAARQPVGIVMPRLPSRTNGRAYRVRLMRVRVCPRVRPPGGRADGRVTVTGTYREQFLKIFFN